MFKPMTQGTDRHQAIDQFLRQAGFGAAQRHALPGDASFRRYERLIGGPQPAMLMDASREFGEDCTPFVAIAEHLSDLGLSAPKILARDVAQGFLVLEDLGDDLFARVLPPQDERALYNAAIDVLVHLRQPAPERFGSYRPGHYDEAVYHREVGLLTDWYLPLITGAPTPDDISSEWHRLWAAVWPKAGLVREVLVLRDYHAENLFWLSERSDLARVGLIDFQDALIGDPAYDLVSLLEDARRDVDPSLAEGVIQYYLNLSQAPPAAFRLAYDVLAAQRNAKIVGIFVRLSERDGKPRYLDLIPRVMAHLRADVARRPVLKPIADFLDRHVPENATYVPPTSRRVRS